MYLRSHAKRVNREMLSIGRVGMPLFGQGFSIIGDITITFLFVFLAAETCRLGLVTFEMTDSTKSVSLVIG